jgi:hypothetical protein
LEEQEPGNIVFGPVRGDDFAREHRQLAVVGSGVVERHLDLVLGEDEAGRPMDRKSHRGIVTPNLPGRARASRIG